MHGETVINACRRRHSIALEDCVLSVYSLVSTLWFCCTVTVTVTVSTAVSAWQCHVSQRRRRRPRVGAINDVHSWMTRPRMSGQLYMTQVTEATWRQIVQKNCPRPLHGDPQYIATKSRKTHVWDRALPSSKFSGRSARVICPRTKYFSL